MQVNTLYKHINNIDVIFEPLEIKHENDYLSIYGYWYNIKTERVDLISPDHIRINKKDLDKWIVYTYNG